jgi:hypothetical protein
MRSWDISKQVAATRRRENDVAQMPYGSSLPSNGPGWALGQQKKLSVLLVEQKLRFAPSANGSLGGKPEVFSCHLRVRFDIPGTLSPAANPTRVHGKSGTWGFYEPAALRRTQTKI